MSHPGSSSKMREDSKICRSATVPPVPAMKVFLLFILISHCSGWRTILFPANRVTLQRTPVTPILNYQRPAVNLRGTSTKQRSDISLKGVEHAEEVGQGKSLSGIPYSLVQTGVDALYPVHEEGKRNALSRADGYWPYVKSMTMPPQDLTYGEFDIAFFASLLDRVCQLNVVTTHTSISGINDGDSPPQTWDGKVFTDIGSGTGRLVLSAAALHKWKLCRGIEILPGIHEFAMDALNKCLNTNIIKIHDSNSCRKQDPANLQGFVHKNDPNAVQHKLAIDEFSSLSLAPIELQCGSFDDPYEYFGDSDCIFVFSTCMSQELMLSLSKAIGRQCKPGTIIITTETSLPLNGDLPALDDDPSMPSGPYKIELLEAVSGKCELVGGESTAFIHRVVTSLWEEGISRRVRPAFI